MSFFEFNIAVSGLFAAQRGLSVSSNNISNATTKGYSRQILGQNASTPLSGMGVGMLGTGVNTTNITRVRDSYLDTKLWSQNDKLGEYKVKVEQNSIIESVYGEPSDTGFTQVFNNLFKSIDSLSKLPDEKERQAAVRQQIINYSKYFNNMSASLSGFQQDLNFELKSKVDEINLLGSKIQSLNNQIYQAEIYGDDANSFRDERELCLDRLSQLINIETKETEVEIDGKKYNQFSVKIAGQTLVDHLSFRQLGITVRGKDEDKIDTLVAEITDAANKLTKGTGLTETDITSLKTTISNDIAKIKADYPGVTFTGIDKSTDPDYAHYTISRGKILAKDGMIKTKLSGNVEDVDGLYDVVWKDGLVFDMSDKNMSGELKGVIDMRDGCGTGAQIEYNGIPYYIKRMNQYVRQFAQTMNEEYSKDKDGFIALIDYSSAAVPKPTLYKKKDGNGNDIYYDASKVPLEDQPSAGDIASKYQAKYQIFTYVTESSTSSPVVSPDLTKGYTQMTAANLSISKEIFDDAGNLRTNYEHYTDTDPAVNPNPNHNDLLLALNAQKSNKKMFREGDPKDYMIAMFSELGINTQEANMYEKTQTSITDTINNQRLAVSQVDTNEEFANLIKYQQAYQAAAKIINTIDGIYETTIFKLGNF